MEISSELVRRIVAHAGATPDVEVCGLLFGDVRSIAEARPCRNVAPDPATRFELDPVALLAAHRGARSGGPAIIGHYHSHPTGQAGPSPRDARAATPDGSLWLVTAGGAIGAWRAVAQGRVFGRFDPVALLVDDPALIPPGVDDDTTTML